MGFRDSDNIIEPIDNGNVFDTDTGATAISSTSEAAASAFAAANSASAALAAKIAAELAETNAETAETNAETAETNASTSATNAATSETNASTSETNASASASAAASSAADAQSSEDDAEVSETNAANSAAAALVSENNASSSETNAATSAVTAATQAGISTTKAGEASVSAAAALVSENNASTSETNAADSETNAATSATNSATSATNAATSATNSATSATNAAASETNAATSATNAAASETNAANSATASASSATASAASSTAASASETAAAASETASASSATSASGSASSALNFQTQAGIYSSNAASSASSALSSKNSASSFATSSANSATSASNSASTATTKASEAAISATNASTSATDAATSATNAATSETNAATSETNAGNSANSATNSATAAQTAQAATELVFDNFDDKFLGTKSSDPSVDNDGNALVEGAMYYNSSSNAIKFYNGSSWEAPSVAASNSATAAATSANNSSNSASAASTSASNAANSATSAATSETNAAISATNASNSASTATTQASNAATSATNASNSATAAATSETNASNSANAAATSASSASTSASNASTSETNAATSEGVATTQAGISTTKATESAASAAAALFSENAAATSESNASTSESNASTSATASEASKVASVAAQAASETAETNAETAQTAAETAQTAAETAQTAAETAQTAAETAETNAATSETNAANSAASASTDAGTATTKAGEAATSATNAAASASTATTKASEAATSASNAATSETNAATSETNAATFETNSSNSATASASSASAASTSETNAATSETNASNSATAAATSASAASTSETNAATSASGAATSATNASNSATAAQTAQTAAEAALDSFDDRYLGEKSSDPTVDNDGDALITGALYFSTGGGSLRVYDGTQWNPTAATTESIQDVVGSLITGTTGVSATYNDSGNSLTIAGTAATTSAAGTMSAADKTKLDGVEAGATGDQTAAEIRALVESATDSNVFTDADHSKLNGIEASADVTDTDNVTAAGALMDSEVTNLAQVKAFNSADYATAAQGALADSALQSYTVSEGDVTAHQAALSITESQISDLGSYLTAHPSITAASSVNNTGRTYIQDITLDSNGHITGLVSATETVTDTTYTSSDFDHDSLTGFVANEHIDWTASSAGTIHLTNLPATALTSVQTAVSQAAMLALTTQEGDVVVRSDENQTYMHNGGTAGTMADFTLLATPTDSVTSVDGATGVVTLNHDTLSGFVANEHIDWTTDQGATNIHSGNYTNTTYSVGDGGLTQKNFTTTLKTKLDGIAAGATANVGDITGVTAGSGITGGGTSGTVTINHADTSSQASVNNSNGTVIQDITLDTYGHITGIASANLDGRYYTETEADSRFVNATGDTMTGNFTVPNLGIGTTSITDSSWGTGNTELAIEGGSKYGVIHLRGTGAGSVDTRYSIGVGDSKFYMAYDDVDGVHRATINSSHQLILNEGSGDQRAFHDGYHPNADKWTTARTLSLSGDASGSVSWDGSANASLSVTVADDSHNHVISNVDGLQTALDGKLSTSGTAADSNLLDGYNSSQSESSNTVAVRNASGYLFSNYFNGSGTFSTTGLTSGMARFTGTNGTDTYGRSYTAAAARTLLNVENGATADQTASEILTAIKTVDGSGSGLDADLLDGNHASAFAVASHTHDDRYYTESEADSRFVNVTGDTLTGTLNYRMLQSQSTSNYDTAGDNSGFSVFYGTSLATNKPSGTDHAVATFSFSNAWQTQLAMDWRTNSAYLRTQENGTWKGWNRLFTDDYHPNADKWTTARTLSLSGDASGSVSWDGSANATLTVAVANDSHTHDGRYYTESEADSRFVRADGANAMTGDLLVQDDIKTTGQIRATGWWNTNTGTSGNDLAVEMGISGGGGYILSYDRNTSSYGSLSFNATSFAFNQRPTFSGNTAFDDGYHPNADKWTTARTLTLSGDASGSVSWDGSANASISVTVADDSHNHVISNVDGLQTALDGKLSTSGKAADSNLLDGLDSTAFYLASNPNGYTTYTANQALNTNSNATFNALYVAGEIIHSGDTNTYISFHAEDHWRVVTGGAERLEVNNVQITSTEPIHAPSFHGSGSSLTGVVLNSGGTMTGPLVIDTDNNSGGGLRLLVNQTSPNQDFYFAEEIVTNLTGSTATTGDREQGGIYIDLNSTATGGDTSNEHRVYGAYIDTYSTGDADIVAGVYAPTYAAPSVGTTGQVMGGYFLASDYGGAGNVTWVRGIHAKAQADNSGSSPSIMEGGAFEVKVYSDADSVGQLYGVKSDIRFDSGGGTKQSTSNPSYVYYAKYENLTGVSQGNNSYLYYGADYGVRSPNAYGVYIAGDLDNYFGGKVTADSFVGDGSALTNIPGPSTTAGAVGTYAYLWRDNAGTVLGSTHAGSTLFYAVTNDDNTTGAAANAYKGTGIVRSSISPSGTWQAMGSAGTYSTAYGQATLYVRIS